MADREKAKWTRLATLGFVLAGSGPVLILAAVLIWGLDPGEELGFFITTIGVAFVSAFLVWRFGTWSKIVGIVAGLLLAMALFWTAFGLAQPASFFDFTAGVLVMPGALLAVGACIAALVARRKGRQTSRAEGGEKLGIRLALGIVVAAALVSGALNLLTRPTATAGEAEASASMREFKFDSPQYEVSAGGTIYVKNDDPFHHTFTIDELGIDEGFVAAGAKVIQIPDRPGTYVLYCRPHTSDPENPENEDMASSITVS